MHDRIRLLLAKAVPISLAFLLLLAAGSQTDVQGAAATALHSVTTKDVGEPSPPSPLDSLRGTLKIVDALILAVQKESETFTKLLEVYKHGGQPWRRLKQDIDRAWREVRGEEII